MRRGYAHAVAAAHQYAVLGPAHIRNAHGEPYSDRCQRDGKCEGRDIGQHAMAVIVRLFPVALIARQIVRLGLGVLVRGMVAEASPLPRRVSEGTRTELEHAMLFFRRNGPLGLHWCQLRNNLLLSSTLATRITKNVGMAGIRSSYSSTVSWNLP